MAISQDSSRNGSLASCTGASVSINRNVTTSRTSRTTASTSRSTSTSTSTSTTSRITPRLHSNVTVKPSTTIKKKAYRDPYKISTPEPRINPAHKYGRVSKSNAIAMNKPQYIRSPYQNNTPKNLPEKTSTLHGVKSSKMYSNQGRNVVSRDLIEGMNSMHNRRIRDAKSCIDASMPKSMKNQKDTTRRSISRSSSYERKDNNNTINYNQPVDAATDGRRLNQVNARSKAAAAARHAASKQPLQASVPYHRSDRTATSGSSSPYNSSLIPPKSKSPYGRPSKSSSPNQENQSIPPKSSSQIFTKSCSDVYSDYHSECSLDMKGHTTETEIRTTMKPRNVTEPVRLLSPVSTGVDNRKESHVLDSRYTKFLADVTADIISRSLYSNRAIIRIMEHHITNSLDRLDVTLMRQVMQSLRDDLGIPDYSRNFEDTASNDMPKGFSTKDAVLLSWIPQESTSRQSVIDNEDIFSQGNQRTEAAAAATKIQRYYRSHLLKDSRSPAPLEVYDSGHIDRNEQRHRAAQTIQANYRGYRVRHNNLARNAVDIGEEPRLAAQDNISAKDLNQAASMIQSQYRSYRERARTTAHLSEPSVIDDDYDDVNRCNWAATRIQSCYRGHATRLLLRSNQTQKIHLQEAPPPYDMVAENSRIEAAKSIQSKYRQHIERKKHRDKINNNNNRFSYEDEHDRAARTIQSYFRNSRSGLDNNEVFYDGEKMISSSELNVYVDDNEVENIDAHLAATRIQSTFRGYQVRRKNDHKISKDKSTLAENELEYTDTREQSAARCIQSNFRGYRDRVAYVQQRKIRENAASTIQRRYRHELLRRSELLEVSCDNESNIPSRSPLLLEAEDKDLEEYEESRDGKGEGGQLPVRNSNLYAVYEDEDEEEDIAARKIQATFRGYRVRQHQQRSGDQVPSITSPSMISESTLYNKQQDDAAIKIQKSYGHHMEQQQQQQQQHFSSSDEESSLNDDVIFDEEEFNDDDDDEVR